MAGKLRGEYAVEKENMRKLLIGARMAEICYGEMFSLLFRQGSMELALRIDAPCWFGEREQWLARADAFGTGREQAERVDCLFAYELTRLRYWNLIEVEKVDFPEDHVEITFPEGNVLSIVYESEFDFLSCEWYLEEVGLKKESERIVVGCSGGELFQRNITAECGGNGYESGNTAEAG